MGTSTSFSDLKSLAAKLNCASDKLNEIIQVAENELGSLNLGIEVFGQQVLQVEYSDCDGIERLCFITHLGWCKLKGRWQLALKIETERQAFDEGFNEAPLTHIENTKYLPLKDANREIRAKAIESFGDLRNSIEKEMERIVAIVDQHN